jgi:hypothetical protein
MKFTLSWLKDHLDTTASLDTIVETLTMIGLEVEGVEDKAKALKPFVVAHVVSAVQHPNADRLRVCMVDYGGPAPIQVVCGAPNAREGLKTVFAPAGTWIPGKNITLGVGQIRRAGTLRGPHRHHRAQPRRADRQVLRRLCRSRRSGDRRLAHPQPGRLHRRARHRPRSRRRRPR